MGRIHSSKRALVSSVLLRALEDAMSSLPEDDAIGARKFIDDSNEMFCAYCGFIDIDPIYLAEKMKVIIENHDIKIEREYIMSFNWEVINENDSNITKRAKVVGGWILVDAQVCIDISFSNQLSIISNGMTFIPDAKHKWKIEDDKKPENIGEILNDDSVKSANPDDSSRKRKRLRNRND